MNAGPVVDAQRRSAGVQSVEVGMQVLQVLAAAGQPLTLGAIAERVQMPAAKAHRYLASLVNTGMVEQRHHGLYDLGEAAARVGIAAIARIDVVNRAADSLPALVDTTGCTAMLSVWGTRGPTVVRWERAPSPLVTVMGVGSVMPLYTSATGQVFLAWLPRGMIEAQAREQPHPVATERESLIQSIRQRGLAIADQSFVPGLYALAAPVFDLQGQLEAAVTLVSVERERLAPGSPAWEALQRVSRYPDSRQQRGES